MAHLVVICARFFNWDFQWSLMESVPQIQESIAHMSITGPTWVIFCFFNECSFTGFLCTLKVWSWSDQAWLDQSYSFFPWYTEGFQWFLGLLAGLGITSFHVCVDFYMYFRILYAFRKYGSDHKMDGCNHSHVLLGAIHSEFDAFGIWWLLLLSLTVMLRSNL